MRKRASRVPPPYLSTRDVADILEFRTTHGVVALIESGALECERVRRTVDGRNMYWITLAEVATYLSRHDPARLRALPRSA